ncbi:unnamed protein product [Vitrella brassicaformis CCMP3155]|uniref:Uncharacterized protein n=1 Tax=Vitrella brassicaformis (strain CCMP3155) TaxID=1169540 RepID=A0A0G4H267_VITBC|nr:unnamed protein product [Vitrella brassicaformis CCMP3155]|eukprot:CEM37502.1 unnamed protein product [Vitrella brassicaformis CCMP3155]
MFRRQDNCTLLRNTWAVAATKVQSADGDDWTVTEVIAENQETQTRYSVKGKVFIDATGDGRLAAEADIPYIIGREGRDRFGEALADMQDDNETMGSSLAFTSRDMGEKMTFQAPEWATKYRQSDFRFRRISDIDHGWWWMEVAWPYNTIRDNEAIRNTLMESLLGIWDYVKNSGKYPKAENLALDWLEWWPCKREGRRFQGLYTMTQNDVLPDVSARGGNVPPPAPYWDRVSHGGWPLDLHNIKGILDTARPPYASFNMPLMYS